MNGLASMIFPRVGVEDEDAVFGRLEQPPIPDFGVLHGGFRPPAFGDVLDGEQDQVRVARPPAGSGGR